jgi:hypothetical protein
MSLSFPVHVSNLSVCAVSILCEEATLPISVSNFTCTSGGQPTETRTACNDTAGALVLTGQGLAGLLALHSLGVSPPYQGNFSQFTTAVSGASQASLGRLSVSLPLNPIATRFASSSESVAPKNAGAIAGGIAIFLFMGAVVYGMRATRRKPPGK